ncbi:hypothetical protein MASR2M78_14380 [Treponema sp.]
MSFVWTIAEQYRGELKQVSFELLSRGRSLADKLGTKLASVVIGNAVSEASLNELILRGADEVYSIQDPRLADFVCESYSLILAHLIKTYAPSIILAAATSSGRTLMPYLAIQVHAELNCRLHRTRYRRGDRKPTSNPACDRWQHHGHHQDSRPSAADGYTQAQVQPPIKGRCLPIRENHCSPGYRPNDRSQSASPGLPAG